MQANLLLSIVVPTYNRADYLDHWLYEMIPLAKACSIPIIISDNASQDHTQWIVQSHTIEYPLLSYHKNETNIGVDKNIERALKYSKSEYTWLLGDTYLIPEGGLKYILDLIEKNSQKYDIIMTNVSNRVKDIKKQDYTDRNKLLSDLGWHTTCLAIYIYNNRVINSGNFKKYYDTNFIQSGIMFDYIADKDFLIHWTPDISVNSLRIKGIDKMSWLDHVFEIGVKKWAYFILSLPESYQYDVKFKCIKDHGKKSGLFETSYLLYFREIGLFNYAVYKQYLHLFPLTISHSKILLLLIALLPKGFARYLRT